MYKFRIRSPDFKQAVLRLDHRAGARSQGGSAPAVVAAVEVHGHVEDCLGSSGDPTVLDHDQELRTAQQQSSMAPE